MAQPIRERLAHVDWRLLSAVFVLVGIGLTMIHSLTWPENDRFVRQIVFLVFACAVFLGTQLVDMHFWRNASVVMYGGVVLVLIGLLLFGGTTRGIQGWIAIGPIALQPAEFAKIITILFLITVLDRLHYDIARLRDLAVVSAALLVPVVLILLQPDFGSAFITFAAGSALILYSGLGKKKIALLACIGIGVAVLLWFGVLADFQKQRIIVFLQPQSDPLGAGYNVRQAILAIGSGGIFGKGLGLGTQSQLNFLPEQETDFIFASLAEELGFVGAGLVLVLYLYILWRIYRQLARHTGLYGSYVLLGVGVMLAVQVVVNTGMNMGLFPVTGIPLPFMSYGGSSLVTSFLSLGIISAIRT